MATDWGAVGAVCAAISLFIVVGAAVTRITRNYFRSSASVRMDKMEIRLWGLPADQETGARKVDGEFDRIYGRLDALPDQIAAKLRDGK